MTRNFLAGIGLALTLCVPVPAFAGNAQQVGGVGLSGTTCTNGAVNVGNNQPLALDSLGRLCINGIFTGTVTSAPVGVTTTPVGGTVTTHGTFQTALAASATRKGCTVENTSTDTEYVFFGANGSAATATSIALGPAPVAGGQGGSTNCTVNGGPYVAQDNIAITSKTADGSATFVVYSQ